MLSSAYVDLALDAVDTLIERARQISPAAWAVLARQCHSGAADRGQIAVSVLVRSVERGRGPLLQVALQRLEDRGREHLHELAELERAVAIESLMIALIAGTQRDLLTDRDYATLLAPFEDDTAAGSGGSRPALPFPTNDSLAS